MRSVSFKIEEDLLEQLDRYAQKYGLNRSETIRKLIEEAYKREFYGETIHVGKVYKLRL